MSKFVSKLTLTPYVGTLYCASKTSYCGTLLYKLRLPGDPASPRGLRWWTSSTSLFVALRRETVLETSLLMGLAWLEGGLGEEGRVAHPD